MRANKSMPLSTSPTELLKYNAFMWLSIFRGGLFLVLFSAVLSIVFVMIGQTLNRGQEIAVALRVSQDRPGRDIFVVDITRDFPPHQIDPTDFDPQDVYWSPDGKRIAFTSEQKHSTEFYVTDLFNFAPRLVTNQSVARTLDWSADGKTIAYADRNSGGVKLIDVDENRIRNLFAGSSNDRRPVWSPDDRQIAFVSNRNEQWKLYIADADGSQHHLLTDYRISMESPSVSWSPDGKQIAFVSDEGSTIDMYIVNVDDGNVKQMTNSEYIEYRPTWSPDGSYIAYWTDETKPGSFSINIISRDSGKIMMFRTGQYHILESNGVITWSADSRHLALGMSLSDGSSRVYHVDVEKGVLQLLLTGNGDVPSPVWMP